MSLTPEQTTAQNFKNFYDRIRPLLNAQHYHVDRSGQELKVGEYTLSGTLPASTSQSTQLGISTRDYDSTGVKRNDFNIEDNCVVIPAGMTVEITSNIYTKPGASSESNTEMHFFDYTHNVAIDYLSSAYHNSGYAIAGTWSTIFAATENTKIGIKCTYSTGQRVINGSSRLVVKEIGRIVDPVQYVSSGDNLEETPVGNIISYMGNNVPKHYLACDGTEYVIGTYPELEAHFISEFGSVNYFGGDGASTWAVPDLRGEFLRGTGTNSHINSTLGIKEGNGAAVGIHQQATSQEEIWRYSGSLYYDKNSTIKTSDMDSIKESTGTRTKVTGSVTEKDPQPNQMYTSRPTNTSVQYCIKYENTYHVIVPSHEYKCEANFGLSYTSSNLSYISYTLNCTSGDSSLISGDYFVAPMDGWYAVSFKSNQISYSGKPAVQYIQINDNTTNAITDATGSGTGHSNFGVNMSAILYLTKGDRVNYRVWTNGNTLTLPTYRSASFCLLTSNYKENIIAGGEVYSTTEQEIGVSVDGKKLYQKTITFNTTAGGSTTTPVTTTHDFTNEVSDIETIYKWTALGRVAGSSNDYTFVPFYDSNHVLMVDAHSDATTQFYVSSKYNASMEIVVTIQYTKTIDTVGQYTYKNSLLLTRPDLWDVGVEYDFGGGLYGKRLTGNFSVTTTLTAYAIDATWKNKSYTPVSSGGWISRGVMLNACNGTLVYMLYKNDSQGLCIQAKDSVQTVSYDIWVTYRKA